MTGATDPRVHAVLGMHRSGTSWLAGTLEELGLELGEVNEAAPYNQKGNRESETIQSLHDAVLRESGGSWRNPPKAVVWSDTRQAALAEIIASMNDRFDRWGFKDPRALLVIDEWRRRLGHDLAFVGIFRHPRSVARSLAARGTMSLDERTGLRLWRRYNDALIALHREIGFPLLRFDAPTAPLHDAVVAVAREWHLPNAATDATFFDAELVHNAEASAVPWSCRRQWRYLVANAVNR